MRVASRPPTVILLAAFALMMSAAASATSAPDTGKPRHAQGETLLCRFVGWFIKVSLPDAPIEAVPLDLVDANFVVAVQVDAIREGHLPDGWNQQIAFAIHSPARFFGGQGIESPAFGEAPPGKFVFTLWQSPKDRRFALDFEPAAAEPAPIEPEGTPREVFVAVAERYYALLAAAKAQEDPVSERRQRAIWNPPDQVPTEATGIVVDSESRPVAGARVVVGGAGAEADGLTGEDGTFRIALHDSSYRMLDLEVTAPGFDRWAFTALYGGVQGERVQLSRTLSRDRLAAAASEPQPERRVWRLLDIVGNRPGLTLDPVAMFAGLGALRPDLRALVASRAFDRQDDMNDSPADRARQLLAWWADPADAGLLAGWIKKQRGFLPVPSTLAAASDLGVCALWAKEHFQREGVASHPPWHTCSAVATDPSGTRVMLRFDVRYAYWGYNQLLVAVREAGAWHLRLAVDWEHYHASSDR